MSAFYHLVRWTSVPLFALYFQLERQGVEHVLRSGPLLLAGNHVSYLDPAVLGSACPRRVAFLMRRSTWSHPAMNWFYRGMRAIPVDRAAGTRGALRAALERLQRGDAVGIFPEGTRAAPGGGEAALLGVALLARRSGAAVVPVGIAGTEHAMPVGRALPEPHRVRVAFGAPLRHEDARGEDDGRRSDELFTRELMSRVRALVGGEAAA